ncbi:16S rRNA (guanine(966)-N(2))-methyltransferase RsmD [soil metagenome]
MIRIIGGELRGRRLETPSWDGLRPTSDRLRETLLNILTPRIGGARVLDGYAGTGAVGIEALSRGASQVTFVEHDPRAEALIRKNLARCGVADRHVIIRARLAATLLGDPFDIVFLDPPYGDAELGSGLAAGAPLLAPGGLLVIEHARRDAAPGTVPGLRRTRELIQGDSALAFYTHV